MKRIVAGVLIISSFFGSTAGEGWCGGLKGHSAREVDGAGGDIYSNEGFSFF